MTRSSLLRVAVTFFTAQPVMGFACCAASFTGHPVSFGDQLNIIVWDSATHTEHFVRQAFFKSDAEHFGFIAPTPSKPDLSDASEEAFITLVRLNPELKGGTAGGATTATPAWDLGDVKVVQEKDVGPYHAVTLLATDSNALASWMSKNHYASTPYIRDWTQAYISKGWYLTAFKVRTSSGEAATGTVRMSFKADKPFNPYYVPADNVGMGHSNLTVFFVSDRDYSAKIGNKDPWVNERWKAGIPDESRRDLATQLKLSPAAIPAKVQVQVFEDYQFPRVNSEDIFFSPAPLSAREKAWMTPIITGVILLLLLLVGKQVRARRPQLSGV